MREEELFVAIAGMIAGVFVMRFITNMITRVICHWRDISLKIRLAEAGMTSEQIEDVVLAGRFEQPRRRNKAIEKAQRPKPVYAHQ